jgi:hypothetical protein
LQSVVAVDQVVLLVAVVLAVMYIKQMFTTHQVLRQLRLVLAVQLREQVRTLLDVVEILLLASLLLSAVAVVERNMEILVGQAVAQEMQVFLQLQKLLLVKEIMVALLRLLIVAVLAVAVLAQSEQMLVA